RVASKSVKRKLAAILAADVAGYSRLAGADEERTPARLRALRDDVGGLHEQRPQVLVAALGDLAEDRAMACRLWSRYQPEPGGEVASLPEAGALANRRDDGARDDRPDPRHCHQTLAGRPARPALRCRRRRLRCERPIGASPRLDR